MKTYFDSPERKDINSIQNENIIAFNSDFISKLFNLLPEPAVLLNEERQIIVSSSNISDVIKRFIRNDVTGLRFGEAIGCIHSSEETGGCGTSKYCSTCGAGQAIKITKETGQPCTKECHITAEAGDKQIYYDIKVTTRMIIQDKLKFILVFIKNIEDQKKRELLERIFYHDLLNISTAISGLVSVYQDAEENEKDMVTDHLNSAVKRLLKEITGQKSLLEAEKGILSPKMREVKINSLLEEVFSIYQNNDVARDKNLSFQKYPEEIVINTDPTLLARSVENLVKNALEAVSSGAKVELSLEKKKSSVVIKVKNDGIIPEEIKLQIFHRSFSTKKESGRGIGTYSVKLLTEQYLNGKVGFISNPEMQTVFWIELPAGNN